LIALIINMHQATWKYICETKKCARSNPVFRRPGGFGGVSIPDPISNSAVNRSSANGTSS
jgi:hypothetical protein